LIKLKSWKEAEDDQSEKAEDDESKKLERSRG
jgi:hypothetical protein